MLHSEKESGIQVHLCLGTEQPVWAGRGPGAEVAVEQEGACQAVSVLGAGRLHSSTGLPGDTGMMG